MRRLAAIVPVTHYLSTVEFKCLVSCQMEFAGEEFASLPATTGVPPARDRNKAKDPKVSGHAIALRFH
jgi:hypothetical protein